MRRSRPSARPPGWPAAGAGALCVLAARGGAATLEGDIARLRCLAKDMRAAALHADPDRVARARHRAQRRAEVDLRRPFAFRRGRPGDRPRFDTPELRRLRVRDKLLRAGEHPGLGPNVYRETSDAHQRHQAGQTPDGDPLEYRLPDGAQRYQRELSQGRWTLPGDWPANPDLRPDVT